MSEVPEQQDLWLFGYGFVGPFFSLETRVSRRWQAGDVHLSKKALGHKFVRSFFADVVRLVGVSSGNLLRIMVRGFKQLHPR
jgi:hypothetical protein